LVFNENSNDLVALENRGVPIKKADISDKIAKKSDISGKAGDI